MKNQSAPIKVSKWVLINIVVPCLPLIIRFVLVTFSSTKIDVVDFKEIFFTDLLFCIVTTNMLQPSQKAFVYFIRAIIYSIMVLLIILIVISYLDGIRNNARFVGVFVFFAMASFSAAYYSVAISRNMQVLEDE